MRAVDLIMKKRDGGELSREELSFLVSGYVGGDIPEYQISAWLMSVFFRGMTSRETADLTELMLRSGSVMDLSGLPGPFVDKHSTGGVGDKVSLILAPIAAACGIKVPMMSGRALGHTGGTLDKLESIPGYRTGLSQEEFRSFLAADGFAMTGQTSQIVPADKKLYALRDVTATVESVPLITASILSKKVAEGADALVFDVKCGSGAFMKRFEDARRLAESLVDTGNAMGKRIAAVITDMSEPLGLKVGNFFEVEESLDCLSGKGPKDLMEATYRLTAWMLIAGEKAKDMDEALRMCESVVSDGTALDLFRRNVRRQGGDLAAMDGLRGSFRSPHFFELRAERAGYVRNVDAYKIGLAGVFLGVGRNTTEDSVYPDVGVIFDRKSGSRVEAGDRILTAYGKDAESLDAARPFVGSAVEIGPEKPARKNLILEELTAL